MNTSFFLHLYGDPNFAADVCRIAMLKLGELATNLGPSCTAVMHAPRQVSGSDPLPVEQDGRLALCQLCFASDEAPADAAVADQIVASLAGLATINGVRQAQSHIMSREWLKPGSPDDRAAPAQAVSFFVQYDGPAEDPAAFHAYYRAHHVPIVFRMPGIRSVTYYLPVQRKQPIIGQSVERLQIVQAVFDSGDDFLKMRQSSQRKEGLRDFENYPKFEGPVTHQVMHSKRLD